MLAVWMLHSQTITCRSHVLSIFSVLSFLSSPFLFFDGYSVDKKGRKLESPPEYNIINIVIPTSKEERKN
jgi:hypothetical protein